MREEANGAASRAEESRAEQSRAEERRASRLDRSSPRAPRVLIATLLSRSHLPPPSPLPSHTHTHTHTHTHKHTHTHTQLLVRGQVNKSALFKIFLLIAGTNVLAVGTALLLVFAVPAHPLR